MQTVQKILRDKYSQRFAHQQIKWLNLRTDNPMKRSIAFYEVRVHGLIATVIGF